jgi:hypothetical protein
MMMREVSLCRVEQLFLGIAGKLRPALAVSDPSVSVLDRGHVASVCATLLLLRLRPAEHICVCGPGLHVRQDQASPLSIRFQIVAGRCTR